MNNIAQALTVSSNTQHPSALKPFYITPDVATYVSDCCSGLDPLQLELVNETARLTGKWAQMQIVPEQGNLLTMLCRMLKAERALEVGTFTGYSSLCIARGLVAEGRLLTLDVDPNWSALAQQFWQRAGVADRIEHVQAPALETIRALPAEPQFDFAFLDGDKGNYPALYEAILARLRSGGVLVIDNVLWSGRVLDPSSDDAFTVAVRTLNQTLRDDPRGQSVMLPLSDGVSVVQKL